MRKRIFALLLALGLMAAMSIPAWAAAEVVAPPDVARGIYYVDQAQCLSSATKDYIDRQNIALTNAVNGQVAVVTLEFLNDLNAEEYAYEVMNQWGVGDSEENNGTVFVLVTAEKKCWITSGSGIEDDLSAGRLEQILEDNCYDALDSGEYDEAVYQTTQAIFGWYENYYDLRLADYNSTQVTSGQSRFGGGSGQMSQEESGFSLMDVLVMLIVLGFILVWAFASPRRLGLIWCCGPTWCGPGPRGPRGPGGPGGGYRGGGFGGGGFSGGGGSFGGGGFSGGGSFGGGSFGGGGGHGGGAGRR